jgi:hypothetical protein
LTSVPIFDRTAALLANRPSKSRTNNSVARLSSFDMADTAAQAFTCQRNILAFISILTTKHADAMLLAANSPVLIPELLTKIAVDTKMLWDQDGKDISEINRAILNL